MKWFYIQEAAAQGFVLQVRLNGFHSQTHHTDSHTYIYTRNTERERFGETETDQIPLFNIFVDSWVMKSQLRLQEASPALAPDFQVCYNATTLCHFFKILMQANVVVYEWKSSLDLKYMSILNPLFSTSICNYSCSSRSHWCSFSIHSYFSANNIIQYTVNEPCQQSPSRCDSLFVNCMPVRQIIIKLKDCNKNFNGTSGYVNNNI